MFNSYNVGYIVEHNILYYILIFFVDKYVELFFFQIIIIRFTLIMIDI